jgi:photosynthetic reaction center cytochrome c subunit
MLRNLNSNYMVPLTSVFPIALRGPSGDVAKINCATCHQGVYIPLFGAKMAAQFPALEGVGTASSATSAKPAGASVIMTPPGIPAMPANGSSLGTSKP